MADGNDTLVLISRQEAMERGLRLYFDGRPCRHGHIAERYIKAHGRCLVCHSARLKARNAEMRGWHPARIAAKQIGEVHYSTGNPCTRGHDAPRQVGNGDCILCARKIRAASKKKPPQNPVRLTAKNSGENTYVDGTPCRNGHQSPARFTANATCLLCSAQRSMRQRAILKSTDPELYYAKQTERGVKHRPKARLYQAVYQSNRRTKKRGLPGSYTKADVETMRITQNGRCFWCDREMKQLEVDHIVPVAKNGASNPSNLVLACRPCNASKSDRDSLEWAKEKGYV